MNNGDDTVYYLEKGFRAVATGEDPTLCREAEDRFKREIGLGQLTILNVAVDATEGEKEFWICKKARYGILAIAVLLHANLRLTIL